MKRYRKKPIVIEAMKWDGESLEKLVIWAGVPEVSQTLGCWDVEIPTLEGTMTAKVGDYIIKGIQGEIYPCKSEIFEASYEEVQE